MDMEVCSSPSRLPTKDMALQILPWQCELWDVQLSDACSWTSSTFLLHQQNPSGGCSLVWRSEQTQDFKKPNKQTKEPITQNQATKTPTNKQNHQFTQCYIDFQLLIYLPFLLGSWAVMPSQLEVKEQCQA